MNGTDVVNKEARVKNHSDELIFHSQGLRRSAANLARSHRRIHDSPRVSQRKELRQGGKNEILY